MPPEACPHCGAEVPPNARACPNCGSDAQTGWSDGAATSGLDLPEDSFDYDDFVKREFAGPSARPRGVGWFWWLAAILVLLTFLAMLLLAVWMGKPESTP
jgi:hypothetical protein